MEKLEGKLNKLWVGLVAGIIGPWFGLIIFYFILFSHKTLYSFLLLVINTPVTIAPIISVTLMFNLIFFFIALRYEWYYAARGVIFSVFIYAPFVVYLKYVA